MSWKICRRIPFLLLTWTGVQAMPLIDHGASDYAIVIPDAPHRWRNTPPGSFRIT